MCDDFEIWGMGAFELTCKMFTKEIKYYIVTCYNAVYGAKFYNIAERWWKGYKHGI